MTGKIFRSALGASLTVLLAALLVFSGCLYGYFGSVWEQQLREELRLAASAVETEGDDYLSSLPTGTACRFTWVAPDGTVLRDTQADAASMENHAQREEIRQALLRYAQDAELVHDGARKLLLEELPPEAEEAPAVPENPRHPKKKKAGPALRCIGVRGTSGREYRADAVLVATGGVSYPTTGSTGDGYKLARQAGHTLVEPVPSLVSLVSHDPDCKKMMGLALKNVTLTLFEDGKAIFDEQGEMLFTHFGISGPLTLSASSHLGDMKKHKYHAEIDLKSALSEEQLYDRITRDFALLANHAAQGALVKLLPSSMQPVMVERWGIDPATKANQITREQKRELVQLIKHWRVSIDARGDLAHAVITSGGVSVREVDPKTMQSKKALGLYFAGEVLDVDAYTGGYNLQIAFCTAQSFANHL